MKKSLMKLMDVVLQKLQEKPEGGYSEAGLRRWLSQRGYSSGDIDAAIQLVRPGYRFAPETMEISAQTPRHLAPFEAYKLTPEARDALARLDVYEMLDPMEREAILDRLEQFEGPITMEELNYLVSWVAGSIRDVEHQQTLSQILNKTEAKLH